MNVFYLNHFSLLKYLLDLSGKYVSLTDSVNSFTRILDGEFDSLPEQAFYLVGGIDDVIAKAETLTK